MVWIKGRYSTNHPRDVAARYLQNARNNTKQQGCTRQELDNPTEANVRKCMREMKATAKSGEDYKATARFLGEDADINKHRRRR